MTILSWNLIRRMSSQCSTDQNCRTAVFPRAVMCVHRCGRWNGSRGYITWYPWQYVNPLCNRKELRYMFYNGIIEVSNSCQELLLCCVIIRRSNCSGRQREDIASLIRCVFWSWRALQRLRWSSSWWEDTKRWETGRSWKKGPLRNCQKRQNRLV